MYLITRRVIFKYSTFKYILETCCCCDLVAYVMFDVTLDMKLAVCVREKECLL